MAETVSSFELIYKPQSPKPPSSATAVAKVVQGYFLSITNLEDKDYFYSLRFRIANPGGNLPADRTLANNTLVIVDTPSGNNAFTSLTSGDGKSFRVASGNITIPARGTALVVVLPQIFGSIPIPGIPAPITSLEVRGYVDISLPLKFEFSGPIATIGPQSPSPVKVLVTPQYRASYLSLGEEIVDQTQSDVPTATGSGRISIVPDAIVAFPAALDVGSIRELEPAALTTATTAVLASLAEADRLDELNRSFAEAGLDLQVRRSGRKLD